MGSLARGVTPLLGRQLLSPSLPALKPALAPKRDRRGVLAGIGIGVRNCTRSLVHDLASHSFTSVGRLRERSGMTAPRYHGWSCDLVPCVNARPTWEPLYHQLLAGVRVSPSPAMRGGRWARVPLGSFPRPRAENLQRTEDYEQKQQPCGGSVSRPVAGLSYGDPDWNSCERSGYQEGSPPTPHQVLLSWSSHEPLRP